jgi:hypothetical protein
VTELESSITPIRIRPAILQDKKETQGGPKILVGKDSFSLFGAGRQLSFGKSEEDVLLHPFWWVEKR